MHQVDFFFDVISPYSWIAFESILRYEKEWPMKVNLKPMMLSVLMKQSGNKPPAMAVPAKAPYMIHDVIRLSKYFGIPLNFPQDFMSMLGKKSSANACRLIVAVHMAHPDKAEAVARAVFSRFWLENKSIFETDDFLEILNRVGLSDAAKIVDSISTDAVKKKILANTMEARDQGGFGAPWTAVYMGDGRTECFFGSDRFHIIAHLMGQKFQGPPRHPSKL